MGGTPWQDPKLSAASEHLGVCCNPGSCRDPRSLHLLNLGPKKWPMSPPGWWPPSRANRLHRLFVPQCGWPRDGHCAVGLAPRWGASWRAEPREVAGVRGAECDQKTGKTHLDSGLWGKEEIAGSVGSWSSPTPEVSACCAGMGKTDPLKTNPTACGAAPGQLCSHTSPVPPLTAQYIPVPVPILSLGAGSDLTLTLAHRPQPSLSLAAQKGLLEGLWDFGDVLGAAGSMFSCSRPTSSSPPGLPEPCSSTTCLTADLTQINGPIV